MDANKVLENTLSPDTATRANAENQLNQAAENNFSAYLITLAQTLANEQASPAVRTAAGIALKNSFSFRDYTLLQKVQLKWLQEVDDATKKEVKRLGLQTLRSQDSRAGQSAGQFIASIATIEVPRNQWPELMPALVENVGTGSDSLKQASLVTIGFICDTEDPNLREALSALSNSILTAVVQGSRKEEENVEVRYAGITALSDCMEFVRSNFENEGERNYIMQVVCEATQASDSRIQAGAFGCLNRIVSLYYDKMKFYMEKALYGLTIIGMRNEDEDVAKLAIEFWCTVCEEEIAIEDDNIGVDDAELQRSNWHFARVAANEALPTLLALLTKQDEDAADDEYNLHRAAYMCLSLFATAVGDEVVGTVATFVDGNLRDQDWARRDAAVSAFGAVLDGPQDKTLDQLVRMGLPAIMEKMHDADLHVRDSAAYALGRVCEFAPRSIDERTTLPQLIEAMFQGISSSPRMATSCCWALMNISDNFAGDPGCETNALSPHFEASVSAFIAVTDKPNSNSQLRIAAYETLNNFVTNSAADVLQVVGNLAEVVLKRLQDSLGMQAQIVSVDDKLVLEEVQTSLGSCLLAIIQRLEGEIRPLADRIMEMQIRVLQNVQGKSTVPDVVFATVGGLANAIEDDMVKYMDAFVPFLFSALRDLEEPALCSMAIGLVSDLVRALGEKAQPYCDNFMNGLLNALQSQILNNQFKPAILQCFGDVAHAIGLAFEMYLETVGRVLQQATHIQAGPEGGFEMVEYVVSLREGITDAWSGIVFAMKSKPNVLAQYVEAVFQLLHIISGDGNRTEGLLRSSMGVLGDLADAFPNGEISQYFKQDWVMHFVKDVRVNRNFSQRTLETARWAKEQVKRQQSIM